MDNTSIDQTLIDLAMMARIDRIVSETRGKLRKDGKGDPSTNWRGPGKSIVRANEAKAKAKRKQAKAATRRNRRALAEKRVRDHKRKKGYQK